MTISRSYIKLDREFVINVQIEITNNLISEALCSFFRREVKEHRLVGKQEIAQGVLPDVIVTDFKSLNSKAPVANRDAKTVLIDTGLRQEEIIVALVSFKINSVLSKKTDVRLLRKALDVICKGEVWLDNDIMKVFLDNVELVTRSGKINSVTDREKEIIKYVSQGLKNKEIAEELCLSEQTVKAHLNRIFRKYNVSRRSQLVGLLKTLT